MMSYLNELCSGNVCAVYLFYYGYYDTSMQEAVAELWFKKMCS